MEDTTKREGAEGVKEGVCACHGVSMHCSGSAHRYCFKRCCMLRCLAALIVLGVVFTAGVCAGGGGRHHRGEFGRYHMYNQHQMMMGQAGWGTPEMNAVYYGNPAGGARVIMMQRGTGAVSAVTVPATTTPVR
jgi:hypothetical protein